MMDRLYVCPAVFEVWEQLKLATGFCLTRLNRSGSSVVE
jgi:hypothetical protein